MRAVLIDNLRWKGFYLEIGLFFAQDIECNLRQKLEEADLLKATYLSDEFGYLSETKSTLLNPFKCPKSRATLGAICAKYLIVGIIHLDPA